MKYMLTAEELHKLAEILHGRDWILEGYNFIPVYQAFCTLPSVTNMSKSRQKISLVQWYYMGFYKKWLKEQKAKSKKKH